MPGLHHAHKRKRIYQKHEPFPHPNKWKRILDRLIYFVGIFAALMTIPQIWQIWIGRNAGGVSILSWCSYLIAASFWVLYGLAHKEKPIILIYSRWIVLDILIILGILIYG